MGTHNIACGLSGLPITEGDRAAYIPLAPSKHKLEDLGPTFTDPCQFYAPVLPPVVGNYGSYGRLKTIEPSVTTTLIESITNRPIDTARRTFTDITDLYDSFGEGFETYVTSPGLIGKYKGGQGDAEIPWVRAFRFKCRG